MRYFLLVLVFSLVFVGLTQSADARSADEPCSYLDRSKIRDSNGNCVANSSGSTNTVSQARSSSEPCSYLKPTKYIRDSSGNCILAPQNTVSNVEPVTMTPPSTTHTTTIIHTPAPVPTTTSSQENLPGVGTIALLGIFALVAYIIFGGKLRQSQRRYRPRTSQKPGNFMNSTDAIEDNSTISDSTGKWNGGFYDDNTKEKFK